MADVTISQLPIATSSSGADEYPLVQGGITKHITYTNLFTNVTLTTPILGTPQSGTLTNCTGLPVAGLSNATANVKTFLTNPTALNFYNAVLTKTGTGTPVFATSPTLVTPALGTPSSGTLTNCTALPIDAGTAGILPIARGGSGTATATGTGNNVLATAPTIISPSFGVVATKTADFTLADTETYIINNKAAAACIVTMPSAALWTGRIVYMKTIQAFALDSVAADIVPLAGGAAGTSILTATAGKWALLVSNGTNWTIMAAG